MTLAIPIAMTTLKRTSNADNTSSGRSNYSERVKRRYHAARLGEQILIISQYILVTRLRVGCSLTKPRRDTLRCKPRAHCISTMYTVPPAPNVKVIPYKLPP